MQWYIVLISNWVLLRGVQNWIFTLKTSYLFQEPDSIALVWEPDFFFFLRFYLFMRETEREAETQAGDHNLSQRQMLNNWATLVPREPEFL